jgi:protein-tyrosine phosphatase
MSIAAGVLTHSGRPSPETYERLRAASLDCWWNLAEELGELIPEMKSVAREVLWARVPDFQAPADLPLFDEQLERVCSVLAGGGRVHVSCLGGMGRTGIAIACIRMRVLGETADDALAATHMACRGPITDEQKAFVRALTAR